MQNQKVKQILENERQAVQTKLNEATQSGNASAVIKLKFKLAELSQFEPQLQFRSLTKDEVQSAGAFQNILKKLDKKFSE